MNSKKTPVAVLGATGVVGQRFVQLLENHPFFEVAALTASERSAGRRYAAAADWKLEGRPPERMQDMKLLGPDESLPCRWAFSALPGSEAGPVETRLAQRGHVVCSNASAHRMDPVVPLLIPEVNAAHLDLLPVQRRNRAWDGILIAAPNCTTTVLVLALYPLHREFTLKSMHVVSMQGLSGAGYPGVSSLDVADNVLTRIAGEEEKLTSEPRKLLGTVAGDAVREASVSISAQCNRVPVLEGHTVCVNASFEKKPSMEDVESVLESFTAPEVADLPGAPPRPVLVTRDPCRPQPRLDRDAGNGMSVVVGRVKPAATGGVQFVVVGHNTIRGAAGGALLNGELLLAQSYP